MKGWKAQDILPLASAVFQFQDAQQAGQVSRHRRFELEGFEGFRMHESQDARMQRLSRKPVDRSKHGCRQTPRLSRFLSILRITNQRKSEMSHMDANLVCTAGLQGYAQQAKMLKSLQQAIMTERRASRGNHGHLQTIMRIARNRRINGAAGPDLAVNKGLVNTTHAAILQLRDQL